MVFMTQGASALSLSSWISLKHTTLVFGRYFFLISQFKPLKNSQYSGGYTYTTYTITAQDVYCTLWLML